MGSGSHDFSDVGFPQDVRNCTTCHDSKVAPNADNYKTNPSRAACGACHDEIDWTTGKSKYTGGNDHLGGPQLDDKNCKLCHQPDSGNEFDASVVGAHVIPVNSKQLKGLNMTLVAATAKTGEKPTVDFKLKDDAGVAINPNTVHSLSIYIAWLTTDYAERMNEAVNTISTATPPVPFTRLGTLTDLGTDTWRYTFNAVIPATWTKGSVGIGMQGYRSATIKGNYAADVVVRDSNTNPVTYVSLDGSAVARRTVVTRDQCNSCHLDLGSPAGISIHGGSRRNPDFCVMCHTANQSVRSIDPAAPETVQFKYMVHSLHMGDERATPTAFANVNTADIAYPTAGAQKNCGKCHKGATYILPLPAGQLPANVTLAGVTTKTIQPITAACIGCHAGQPGADAHIMLQTTSTGAEACVVCHGTGKDADVAKVHTQ